MESHSPVTEIYLQPGEFHFGGRDKRIRTLLGSCIAITMWHPTLLIGGMCHFMLPSRKTKSGELDGRYADEAILLFHREIEKSGTKPGQFQVKLFGGGSMFDTQGGQNVSSRNVDAARQLLARYGHEIYAEHVGMRGHRNVIFDIRKGSVLMRHVDFIQDE